MSLFNEGRGGNPEKKEALAGATMEELVAAVEEKLKSGEDLAPEVREKLKKILDHKSSQQTAHPGSWEYSPAIPEKVRQLVQEVNAQLYGNNPKEREAFFDRYGDNRVGVENALALRSGAAKNADLKDSGPGEHLRVSLNNQHYLMPFSPEKVTGPNARYFSKDIYDFEADDYKRDKEYQRIELVEPAQITQSGGKSWIVSKKGKVRLY